MEIMENKNYLNDLTSNTDIDPESLDILKIVIVYGTLFCVGAYNIINAISNIFLSLPFDFSVKPGNAAMTKWAVFDIVEILLHLLVAALCLIAFKAVTKNAKNLETLVTAPFAFEFFGYTIKSVMYREFFCTMYKMRWQNILFIITTLAMITANLIYLKRESIYEMIKKLN